MNSQDLARLFVDVTGDALLAATLPDTRICFANAAFSGLTGFEREEVMGEALSVLQSVGYSSDDGRERSLDARMLAEPGFYNDVALPARDGTVRYVTVKVRHTEFDGKKVALAVISDDTERQLLVRDLMTKHQSLETAYIDLEKMHTELKHTQEQMLQASKLVALGELAAGMSHELNQPLTGIRGFAQESIDILRDPKPSKKHIAELCKHIVTNADKMAALLSHLREFTRKGKSSVDATKTPPEPTSFDTAYRNVFVLLERQFAKHGVKLEARGLEAAPPALAKLHPVEQVLINLLTNARDAVVERMGVDPAQAGKILVTARAADGFVELRVTDNGAGIPDTLRSRIFDPFFSTKETGKGMGLGLSISFSIAHSFGGELLLESTSSSGTTFVLRLPEANARKQRSAA